LEIENPFDKYLINSAGKFEHANSPTRTIFKVLYKTYAPIKPKYISGPPIRRLQFTSSSFSFYFCKTGLKKRF
tara:strand:- start:195 stop:413 length:219 start_codon:yes stop_codon:yes gene_type:complete